MRSEGEERPDPGEGTASPRLTEAGSLRLATADGPPLPGAGQLVRRMTDLATVPELGLVVMILAAGVVFTLVNPAFGTGPNIESLFRTIVFTGVVLIGQATLLIVGEFDLSVGSVAGMGAIVAGVLMVDVGLPIPVAVLLSVASGATAGLVSGLVTTKVGIPAFVTTLSMLFVARGIGYVLSGGDPVYPLPSDVGALAKTVILGIPSSVWIFLALVLLFDVLMRFTIWGRVAYATGGSFRTARLAGIATDRVKIGAFMLTGGLSAFAGVLLTSRLGRADPSIGLGWELNVIAAAVVGGVRLGGGVGTMTGAFLGLLFLQVIQTGLVIAGVDATLQPVVSGVVMIVAVALDLMRRQRLG